MGGSDDLRNLVQGRCEALADLVGLVATERDVVGLKKVPLLATDGEGDRREVECAAKAESSVLLEAAGKDNGVPHDWPIRITRRCEKRVVGH